MIPETTPAPEDDIMSKQTKHTSNANPRKKSKKQPLLTVDEIMKKHNITKKQAPNLELKNAANFFDDCEERDAI